MKIAEALSRVKALKGRLSRLFSLAAANLYHVEGETPEFSASALLAEWWETAKELRGLMVALQRTNHRVRLPSGLTLAEALLEMADLRSRAAQYERLVQAKPQNQYLRDERVVYRTAIPADRLVQTVEEATAAIRALDNEIQRTNWTNDLVE